MGGGAGGSFGWAVMWQGVAVEFDVSGDCCCGGAVDGGGGGGGNLLVAVVIWVGKPMELRS